MLLQLLKLEDDKQPSQPAGATAQVRLVVATFSEDGEQGAYDVLNVLLRIRERLLATGVIGQQFEVQKPLEAVVYPDNTEVTGRCVSTPL